MDIVIQIVLELVLQVVVEIFVNFGIHGFRIDRKPHPFFAAIGYFILGAVFGGVSLFIFKELFIHDETFKLINLFATPVLIGMIMSAIGKVREKKEKEVIRLEKFFYGFLFAFAFALVRFIWAS